MMTLLIDNQNIERKDHKNKYGTMALVVIFALGIWAQRKRFLIFCYLCSFNHLKFNHNLLTPYILLPRNNLDPALLQRDFWRSVCHSSASKMISVISVCKYST